MATHLPSTAPPTLGTNAANKTNTASLLMEDDTFDLDDAALAAAVDSIIENHNKESEKVKREKEGERRGGDGELLSPFDLQERQNALSVTPTSTSLNSTSAFSTPTTSSFFNTHNQTHNQIDDGRRRRRWGDDGSKREPTAAAAQGFGCRCRPSPFLSADNAPRCRRLSIGCRSPGSGCGPSAAASGSRRSCSRAE